MGEYWKPVNLTRGEFIHPHHWNCGLKFGEWNHPGSAVRKAMAARWDDTDHVVAMSDYGGLMVLQGEGDDPSFSYDSIEDHADEVTR